jgi:hypothetical protein
VGIDLVEIKYKEQAYHWLNIICWGTQYQQVMQIDSDHPKQPMNVWRAFVDAWIRIFGVPEMIVLDPGTEFKGEFADQCQARGVLVLPTDPRAPWQNGKTERAGKAWKGIFRNATRKDKPLSFEDWRTLGHECCAARNRYHNRSGFSPMQRVFGTSHRLPSSLLSDNLVDPIYCYDNPSADFHRAEELRRLATRAWARLDSRERLGRALRARHRYVANVAEGQIIYVYRQPKVGRGYYTGPGIVILPTSGGAWVNMKGSLWRCSNEQMREKLEAARW